MATAISATTFRARNKMGAGVHSFLFTSNDQSYSLFSGREAGLSREYSVGLGTTKSSQKFKYPKCASHLARL